MSRILNVVRTTIWVMKGARHMYATRAGMLAVNSVVLFNLADHILRRTGSFGVLLGQQDGSIVNVYSSFELLVHEGNIAIDHLQARYGQFVTVFQQYTFVGVYQMNTVVPSLLSVSVMLQVQAALTTGGTGAAMVLMMYDLEKNFKAFAGMQLMPTPVKIAASDEIEKISTFTVSNHSRYSAVESNDAEEAAAAAGQLADHCAILLGSLDQLESRVQKILTFLASGCTSKKDVATRARLQTLIAHLAQKVATIDSDAATLSPLQEDNLMTLEVGLLNAQASTLESLRVNISRQIIKAGVISQHYALPLHQIKQRQLGDPDFSNFLFAD